MTNAPGEENQTRVILASDRPLDALGAALEEAGHRVQAVSLDRALASIDARTEAVVLAGPRAALLDTAVRLKTRHQLPLLPVLALAERPRGSQLPPAVPDAWLGPHASARHVVERLEELVRIRRAEQEMARLNTTLAELAAENGRLYDRARRDAEETLRLVRELQHRVRNNLASIQALLVLERHRAPARPLTEALDVALARLRSMAALQDSIGPGADTVHLRTLAEGVMRGAVDIFGAGTARCEVMGDARVPPRTASGLAIVLNELLTNALKHARARRVAVEISGAGPAIELVVDDDGCGMPSTPAGGSGLMIARTVVRNELGGELAFAPVARGTRARVLIPRPDALTGA